MAQSAPGGQVGSTGAPPVYAGRLVAAAGGPATIIDVQAEVSEQRRGGSDA